MKDKRCMHCIMYDNIIDYSIEKKYTAKQLKRLIRIYKEPKDEEYFKYINSRLFNMQHPNKEEYHEIRRAKYGGEMWERNLFEGWLEMERIRGNI